MKHRIYKALKAIGLIISNPWLLNKVLSEPEIWKTYISKKYGLDNGFPVITFSDLFEKTFREDLEIFTFLDGGSLATDLALLKALAREFPACKYFEIGTWRGESVINVSKVAETCYTLNLSEEELRKAGVSESIIRQQDFFSKSDPRIIHLKGNSASLDYSSFQMKFDLIFIDGDHHYDYVKNDTEKVFKNLVHDNSVIVWHDYATNPGEIRFEVMAGILDALPAKAHSFLYYVAHTKSAIYTTKNIARLNKETSVLPGYFNVRLNYNDIGNGNT